MPDRVLIRLKGASAAMRVALREAALPVDDLCDSAAIYELRDDMGALAWAALERVEYDALLRSVVVPPKGRGQGLGADLVSKMGAAAKQDGIVRLWLLTETAEPFFARMGFERAEREIAPDAIRSSTEFRSTCPASAVCMTLSLA